MLEGIFYQRYENKGSDLQRTSRICLQIHTHFYLLWQADTHQSYIITDKVQFFFKRNKSLLIVIKHMPQQFTQLLYCLLCLVTIKSNQSIDII